ncbi:multicopper oxidase domain-containing protein [bacterium]|nr:multicopper oxidase domain-containing protein [bacterium]
MRFDRMAMATAAVVAGTLLAMLPAPAHAADVHLYLVSRMNGTATLSDGTVVATWGFRAGSGMGGVPEVPGPILWANEGDHVFVHFDNSSPMDHTIHLHGLDVDQQNDGVPQTSFVIPPMGSYTYEFDATHAGSYNYHCHVETLLHLHMGMYGAVNILPADGSNHAWTGGPAFDFERTWITGEVDVTWHQFQTASDFTVYTPDYFLVNGKDGVDVAADPYTTFQLTGGETALVRLGNMGYLPVRYDFGALSAEAVASDGRPLPSAIPGTGLMVTPGERYDVLVQGSTDGAHVVGLEYLDLYDGSVLGTATVPVTVTGSGTGVPAGIAPLALSVSDGFPSPTRGGVSFRVTAPRDTDVDVRVIDVRGRLVATGLVRGNGTYRWDGRDREDAPAAAGVYYALFRTGDGTVTRKVVRTR